eukprot:3938742-Rhodomonas_salina.1
MHAPIKVGDEVEVHALLPEGRGGAVDSTKRVPVGRMSRSPIIISRESVRGPASPSGTSSALSRLTLYSSASGMVHTNAFCEPVPVGVDEDGASRPNDLEIRVDQDVGAIGCVAYVVRGHQVEPVRKFAEDLGGDIFVAEVGKAARSLGDAGREVLLHSPGFFNTAWKVAAVEPGVVEGGPTLRHKEPGQPVEPGVMPKAESDHDVPGVGSLVELRREHSKRRGAPEHRNALALEHRIRACWRVRALPVLDIRAWARRAGVRALLVRVGASRTWHAAWADVALTRRRLVSQRTGERESGRAALVLKYLNLAHLEDLVGGAAPDKDMLPRSAGAACLEHAGSSGGDGACLCRGWDGSAHRRITQDISERVRDPGSVILRNQNGEVGGRALAPEAHRADHAPPLHVHAQPLSVRVPQRAGRPHAGSVDRVDGRRRGRPVVPVKCGLPRVACLVGHCERAARSHEIAHRGGSDRCGSVSLAVHPGRTPPALDTFARRRGSWFKVFGAVHALFAYAKRCAVHATKAI